MVQVRTKNGVKLYISVTDDCAENKGGYFCQVYLDENDEFEYDNFVIHCDDKRTINECCADYANDVDDSPIIVKKMSKIQSLIFDTNFEIFQFFLQHIACNKNISQSGKKYFQELMDKMIDAKGLIELINEEYIKKP